MVLAQRVEHAPADDSEAQQADADLAAIAHAGALPSSAAAGVGGSEAGAAAGGRGRQPGLAATAVGSGAGAAAAGVGSGAGRGGNRGRLGGWGNSRRGWLGDGRGGGRGRLGGWGDGLRIRGRSAIVERRRLGSAGGALGHAGDHAVATGQAHVVGGVGQQRDVARALDFARQLGLILGCEPGLAARLDLASIGEQLLQLVDILVVDQFDFLGGEDRERGGGARTVGGCVRASGGRARRWWWLAPG